MDNNSDEKKQVAADNGQQMETEETMEQSEQNEQIEQNKQIEQTDGANQAEENEQAYINEAAPAASAAISAADDATDQGSAKTKEQLEQAKQISRQYISYYINVLKNPSISLSRTNESHFQNALITMAIIAVLFPLFVVLSAVRIGIGVNFFGMFIQPLLYACLGMAAAVGAVYVFDKWQGGNPNWKQIAVQYATLLVPAPICLIVAILFSLIGLGARPTLFFFVLSIVFILVALNILLIRQPSSLSSTSAKFDPLYSFVIANIVVGFFFYGIATSAISALIASLFRSMIPF